MGNFLDDLARLPGDRAATPPAPAGFLPTTPGGRLAAGLLSAAILPPAAAGAFLLPPDPPGGNPGWWAAQIAFRGLMSSVVTLSVCGLAWAVVRPSWAGSLAWRSWRRLRVLLVIFYLATAASVAWLR